MTKEMKSLPIGEEIKIATYGCTKEELVHALDSYRLTPTQLNSIGNAFRNLDELELAEKAFLKSIDLAPGYDEPYAHLISLYGKLNRFDLCEAIYQKGSKLATKKTYIMYHDGRLKFLKGDYNGSLVAGRCILIDEQWRDENAIVLVIKSLLMLIKTNQSENSDNDLQEAKLAWKRGLTLFPGSQELLELSKAFSK
ncbi:MAG: hypothetical protein AABY93_12980 [Bacteroidota bacterium]